MRIVISAPSFFPRSFGGGEIYVYRIAKEFLRRGAEVAVLTAAPWTDGTTSSRNERYSYGNIAVIALAINPADADQAELHTGLGPATLKGVKEILQELRPDLVHINGLKPAMTLACSELRIPHVVTAHHAGIACALGTLVPSSGSVCGDAMAPDRCVRCASYERWPKWFTGGLISRMPPSVYRPLGAYLNAGRRLSHLGRGLVYPWLVEQAVRAKRKVLDLSEIIVAPSAAFRDLLIRNGRDPETVAVVPHGIVPLQAVPLRKSEGRPVRFGYVGRIEPLKGLHVILDALERLPDGRVCELHVFGAARHPWDETYLKEAMEGYEGTASVDLHGSVPPDGLSEAYERIDVLVVPSLLPEAFGLVVAEAFSAKRPVIAFDSGALPELVTEGVDGFIVKQKDSLSLASAMQVFIDNRDLAAHMSQQTPRSRTMPEHADDLMRIYDRVMAARAVCSES